MKVLPRIIGGSMAIRHAVMQMLGWARDGNPDIQEDDATKIVAEWDNSRRLGALSGSKYPRTAARLCLMWERLQTEGFTSFWI